MTIPASYDVNILPGVVSTGGNALNLVGLFLTNSWRVPAGTVQSFPNAASVSAYFGASSNEYAKAVVYFAGFTTATQTPANLLFAQCNVQGTAAWLKSGQVSSISLAALQGLSGSLSVVIDGYTHSAASIVLSAATSYSSAAALIQTGLNGALTSVATVTGSIAAGTSSFTGSIAGNVLTVTATSSGTVVPGTTITGTGISSTIITGQLSGTTGGVGTYTVQTAQAAASTTISGTYGTLTVTAVSSGTLSVGQTLSGTGLTAGTLIWGLGTGTGQTGTYYVSPTQTAASTTISAAPTPCAVTYDSVSGSFVITSGVTGSASSIAFATGTLSTSLLFTSATGATMSQGTAPTTPATYMAGIIASYQNWATFTTLFDPDYSATGGNAQKLAFAAWTNTTNNRFMYVCVDRDASPTLASSAPASLGAQLIALNYSGTFAIYEPSDLNSGAFVCGLTAAIDQTALNGSTTFKVRSQTGLVAGVTSAAVAANLNSNGYNCISATATATQTYVYLREGIVSGPFQWAQAYVNQIWLNQQLQQSILVFMQQVKSFPYNAYGYALVEDACLGPINTAITFGMIQSGITLTPSQIAYINTTTGVANAAAVVQTAGYYLQVQNANPTVRQARQSPPCYLFYTDGGSIHNITLNSLDTQ